MSLERWLRKSWVVKHETTAEEIRSILDLAERDLQDCQSPELSNDGRFSIAYNAALQIAHAALVASGYRVTRAASRHHYTIQSLAHRCTIWPQAYMSNSRVGWKQNARI